MKQDVYIELTQGKRAVVDQSDYGWLSSFKWCYNNGYAVRSVRGGDKVTRVHMHRAIMDHPSGKEVDHINQDKLDNRRSNLRAASRKENAANTGKTSRNKSGYIGVSWRVSHKKWVAQVGSTFIGYFDDTLSAAKARDKVAKDLYGEFARLNFKEAV